MTVSSPVWSLPFVPLPVLIKDIGAKKPTSGVETLSSEQLVEILAHASASNRFDGNDEPSFKLTNKLQGAAAPDANDWLSLKKGLTADTYADVARFLNLSYAATTRYWAGTVKSNKEQAKIYQEAEDQINTELLAVRAEGWEPPVYIHGKTGYDNRNDDITAVASYDVSENLIIISFHGSTSGSVFQGYFTGEGDWGANHDNAVESNETLNLRGVPDYIVYHRGFARNFQSCQINLYNYLDAKLLSINPSKRARTRILVIGHSKGAAMATIAAPAIQGYLDQHTIFRNQTPHVKALYFSAPRAYYGSNSAKWAESILGKDNMIHIYVTGDPVTALPSSSVLPNFRYLPSSWSVLYHLGKETLAWFGVLDGYRSIGTPIAESSRTVADRLRSQFGKISTVQSYAGMHYGVWNSDYNAFWFGSSILMPYENVMASLNK